MYDINNLTDNGQKYLKIKMKVKDYITTALK